MNHIYIIHESQSSKLNGIGTYLKALVRCCKDNGCRVSLVDVNADEEAFRIVQHPDYEQIFIPSYSSEAMMDAAECVVTFLRMYLDRESTNIFMINQYPCNGLVNSLRASFPESFIYFVIHDMAWTATYMGDVRSFERALQRGDKAFAPRYHMECDLFQSVDKVVCLSPETYQILRNLYHLSGDKVICIPNGMEDCHLPFTLGERLEVRTRYHISPDEFVIVWIGRCSPLKGLKALFSAFQSFLTYCPSARLVIIGPLFNADWMFDGSSSCASRVTFTGHISRAEVFDWYRIADIGVIPSYTEQCSYAGIEMLMFGLPIVTTDGNGLKSMFVHEENALVANIGSRKHIKTLSRHLMHCFREMLNTEIRERLGRNARTCYCEKYTQEKMSEGYAQIFKNIDNVIPRL